MDYNDYFSHKNTGGAISQRGFRYQTLVSIKYAIDNIDNPDFYALALEQEDDFTLCFNNESIPCQVKSVQFSLRDLRNYLDSMKTNPSPKYLICSAFSNEINSLLSKKEWLEFRIKRQRFGGYSDSFVDSYKASLKNSGIDYYGFQSTTLVAIPINYAETIVTNSIITWAQRNKCSINAEKLLLTLYNEISRLSVARGLLEKEEIIRLINNCTETTDGIYVYWGLLDSDDISTSNIRKNTPKERWIYYTEHRKHDEVQVYPIFDYWENIIKHKKPITPISYVYDPFDCDLPNMDIKILNCTDKPLFITEIEFNVESSRQDLSPLIYLERRSFSSNKRHLELHNDGWGTIKNVKIYINSSPEKNDDFSSFKASADLGTIDSYLNIDLTDMLQELTSIDFNTFDNEVFKYFKYSTHIDHEMPIYDSYYRKLILNESGLLKKYLGDYQSGFAYVNGLLDFYADTLEKKDQHFSLLFSAVIDLYDYCDCGIPLPPSYQYDVSLRISDNNYVVRKSISQTLKPGESDRFNIRIHCSQSSQHVFSVCLIDISGRRIPVEKRIILNMCVPRSVRGRYSTQNNSF